MTGRVLVLGSLNVDLVTSVDRHPQPGETVLGVGLSRLAGGKGANQAVAAARAGAAVSMVGAVGDDAAGRSYLDRLRRRGVNTDAVAVHPGEPTGTALIVVDARGENTIVVAPGANGRVGRDAVLAVDHAAPGDVLLVQLEVPLETVTRACTTAAELGVRVVLNVAPYAALPAEVLAVADPVVANDHEAGLLAADGISPPSLLVTRGADGAEWDGLRLPADAAEVVDTTGAGDAFCGALAAALAGGADREQALRAALAAGAEAVTHEGAQPEPTLD